MSVFFDTNVLIYAQQRGAKAETARALLASGGTLSVQILNEFAAVSFRKLGRSWTEIAEAVQDILAIVDPPVALTTRIHIRACSMAETHRVSFYDALVLSAALEAGCSTLYSEALQHGGFVGELRIVNPFAP